jgi:hypothetical protein
MLATAVGWLEPIDQDQAATISASAEFDNFGLREPASEENQVLKGKRSIRETSTIGLIGFAQPLTEMQ